MFHRHNYIERPVSHTHARTHTWIRPLEELNMMKSCVANSEFLFTKLIMLVEEEQKHSKYIQAYNGLFCSNFSL